MSAANPTVTSGDRLSLTLFISVVIHALIILGIGFTWAVGSRMNTPPLIEITLAERPQEQAPEDHDYLAQANQDGGGESEEKARPQKQQKALTPGVPEGKSAVTAAPKSQPKPTEQTDNVVTTEAESETQAPKPDDVSKEKKTTPDRAALINARQQVATSSEFTTESESVYARYPTKRRISARTKQHAAAAYMREWVNKVEKVGNLNYPHEARTRGLSGTLIVEVTLEPDGSVKRTRVLEPSRHPVLDQAAQRIVALAGPYARIPEDVLQGNDLLVITRTWEFRNEGGLTAN